MDVVPHLTFLRTSSVVPATPTHKELMYLSSLDLFWREIHYNRRLLFYYINRVDYVSVVDLLKRSLSEALVYFYPWAGRLIRVGEAGGRIAVDCNDLGVEFVEASIDLPFSDIEETNFHMKPFFDKLIRHSDHAATDIFELPLLSIQVTQFLNGGMALGLAQSHVIADGNSLWYFMNSWAVCGRGMPISMPPLLDRTAFKLDKPSQETARLRFVAPKDEDQEGHVVIGGEGAGGEQEPNVLVQGLFLFSGEMLKRLKNKASEEGGKRSFTSYEVLCAHFWRHVTKARRVKEQTRIHFTVLVNCRSRLSRPLPASYFGNVIQFGIAFTKAGELLNENFAATAHRIHETIINCTEGTLWEFIHWLELHDNSLNDAADNFRGVGMMVASSPRFPVYEVDFGWGRPKAVRAGKVRGDGGVFR